MKADDSVARTITGNSEVNLLGTANLLTVQSTSPSTFTFNIGPDVVKATDSIDKLFDVVLTSPANNQIFRFNSSTGKWVNSPLSSLLPTKHKEKFENGTDYVAGDSTITLDFTPSFVYSVARNGVHLVEGIDYTVTGTVITFATPFAALPTDNNIEVVYEN